MLDHALRHHGADTHAGTAGSQHHNALLSQAVGFLTLHLQASIHSCQSCGCSPLQQKTQSWTDPAYDQTLGFLVQSMVHMTDMFASPLLCFNCQKRNGPTDGPMADDHRTA